MKIYLRDTQDLLLYKEDEKYFAKVRSGTESQPPQEVDDLTADALCHGGPDQLIANAIDAGIVLDAPSQFAELKERRSKVRSLLRPDEAPLSVFIDTTTVHNAQRALEGDINAVFLVDLAIVAFAAVMYDEIILLRHPGVGDLPAYFRKISLPTRDFADVYFKGLLNKVVNDARGSPHDKNPPPIEAIQQSWETFLRLEPGSIKLDLSTYDKYQDSEHWDGIVGGGLFTSEREVFSDSQSEITRFIEAQTVRTLFNSRLSGIAGIPYFATSLRNPVHSMLLESRYRLSLAQDVIASRLKPNNLSELPKTSFREAISLPLVLGLVLKDLDLSNIDKFWSVVDKYREISAPLRKDIKDFTRNDVKPKQIAQRYLSWVYDEIPRHTLDGATTAAEKGLSAALYAVPPVTPTSAAISAIFALLKLATKPVVKAVAKQLNPAVHVVFRLDEEARGLLDLQPQISRVWGRDIERRDVEQLDRLTKTNPYWHLRLRQL